MPIFNDSDGILPIIPEGDYIYTVNGLAVGISKGGRTRGADMFELELKIEPSGKLIYDALIDAPTCSWKMDTFLKSAGVQIKKGESFDFRREIAVSNKCKYVRVLGQRGWCRVIVEPYTNKAGQAKTANKIATYYTDRPKLEALGQEEEDAPF